MKHSLIIKFIAVFLCAASLLCAVGSGIGIFVMTEGGLYNRTVDEMLEERIQSDGSVYAHTIAARFASETLGGAPSELTTRLFHSYTGILSGQGGYAIVDAEGSELQSVNPELKQTGKTYSFPVMGQYIYLVSAKTEEEKYPAPTDAPEIAGNSVVAEGVYLYEALPPEGAVVNGILYTFEDGESYEYWSDSDFGIGTVSYTRDGQLCCLFTDPNMVFEINRTVTEMIVVDQNDHLLYEARYDRGVGYFTESAAGGSQMYLSSVSMDSVRQETIPGSVLITAAETAPVTEPATEETTVLETAAATVPETVPETIAPTVPETTIPQITVELEDNIPQDTITEVMEIQATLLSGEEVLHQDAFGIGRINHGENGTVDFVSYDHWETAVGSVTQILFLDAQGQTIFSAKGTEAAGELLLNEEGRIAYRITLPKPVPEETVPETTAATVPETVAETVPQTTAETVAETIEQTVAATEMFTEPAEPLALQGRSLDEYEIETTEYYDYKKGQTVYAEYIYLPMPEYTVELYLNEDAVSHPEAYDILRIVWEFRNYLLPALGASILLFVICTVYLCAAAAHQAKTDELRPGGLNRIPLDLYLGIAGLGVPCLCIFAVEGGSYLLRKDLLVGCACAAGLGFAASLLAVGLVFALAAQIKTPGGFWWHNSVCGRCIRLMYRFVQWSETKTVDKVFPTVVLLVRKFWKWVCRALIWLYRFTEKTFLWIGRTTGKIFGWLGKRIHRFLSLLPLTWQWLLVGFMMFLMIGIVFAANGEELLMVLCLGICIGLIVYGAHCFGSLLDSTRKMSEGDLNTKVDDKMMIGGFRDFADALNALAGVAMTAAQKQLKSERMKTELITNVSHDIKTPLTSIINYVDLLRKPHTQEEGEQYMEVLDRQSQRLKKLIDDLMDMSKASTGNMSVEITQLDAVESVNQALGEFSDKLEKAQLSPVFRHTEPAVPMMADGRLVWRVLSNLLGNAVKYAMPGTRLYLDLMQVDGTVVLSMKNISREELNIDAEELMERFVRGDDSRNTEGSGLGLNIAKSLMELQKGQMQLLVDGDLFKVTLTFPGA